MDHAIEEEKISKKRGSDGTPDRIDDFVGRIPRGDPALKILTGCGNY
jgi:hypothetical protein